jgi:serine/threonine protein kinase
MALEKGVGHNMITNKTDTKEPDRTDCWTCAVRRFAMKTLEKAEMLERNKVMRVLTEAKILSAVDHPFLASLYGTIVTDSHLHFLMQVTPRPSRCLLAGPHSS